MKGEIVKVRTKQKRVSICTHLTYISVDLYWVQKWRSLLSARHFDDGHFVDAPRFGSNLENRLLRLTNVPRKRLARCSMFHNMLREKSELSIRNGHHLRLLVRQDCPFSTRGVAWL
jgi:hypothetical protein